MNRNNLKIVVMIFRVLFSYISLLIPRNRRLIVFGAWFGKKYADNSKYLYEYMLKEKKFRCYWVTESRKVYKNLQEKSMPVILKGTIKAFIVQLRAKYYVTSNGINDVSSCLLGGALNVELWHGIPVKKIEYDDRITRKESLLKRIYKKILGIPVKKRILITTSETMVKIYRSAFRERVSNIHIFGQPRNDTFFCDSEYEDEVLDKCRGKKIALYLPTHRNEGKKRIQLEKILDFRAINEICIRNNYVFLIKMHFFHFQDSVDLSEYSNIMDVSKMLSDVQELLKKASILITDYSSCFIDYLLLNRPILFYCFDLDEYQKQDREFYFSEETRFPGTVIQGKEAFSAELGKVASGEGDDLSFQLRNSSLDVFYSKDARSSCSKRIAEAVFKY